MIDKITVNFIDINQEPTSICWPTKNFIYVEQLLFDVLESLGVGPIFKSLFGFRLSKKSIWLAPNTKISRLSENDDKVKLNLRVRFIPSALAKLKALDRVTFEMLFAQCRHDFLHTRFTDRPKAEILLDSALIGLIATDILRLIVEKNMDPKTVFGQISHKDFVPHKGLLWQRPLIFYCKRHFEMDTKIQVAVRSNPRDPNFYKQSYIGYFVRKISPDYAVETYNIQGLYLPFFPQRMTLRVAYRQDYEESSCSIEYREPKNQSWTKLCDLESICYATVSDNLVELNRIDGRPCKIGFDSDLHARSFASTIEGYHRLMKKWHGVNFCRDVTSPDLVYLHKIKCHGPIGFGDVRKRITSKTKRPGTFMIRRCNERNNRFIIDVLLMKDLRLHIEVAWKPEKNLFSIIGHNINADTRIELKTTQKEYQDLKTLVDDVEIKMDAKGNFPPIQLSYWLPPSEYDDYPLLLVCMSKKAYKEKFEDEYRNRLSELPRLIPLDMLKFDTKLLACSNGLVVRLAEMNNVGKVIFKKSKENHSLINEGRRDVILKVYPPTLNQFKNNGGIEPRGVTDWMFLKNPLFAETIGVCPNNGLIQEFLDTRLDLYLNKYRKTPVVVLKAITFQLAHALLFLQEQRIVHGKIRCHNIYLVKLDPVKIKITDPLGTFDADRDQAFLPPEYSCFNNQIVIKEYDPGLDIWAVGTTIWQIFSHGEMPKPYICSLLKPALCPDPFWDLVESCRVVDRANRATPQTLYRDLHCNLNADEQVKDYSYIWTDMNNNDNMVDKKPIDAIKSNASGKESSQNDGKSLSNSISILKKVSQSNGNAHRIKKVCHYGRFSYIKSQTWKLFKKGSESSFDSENYDKFTNLSTCSRNSLSSSSENNISICTDQSNTAARSIANNSVSSNSRSTLDSVPSDDAAWQIDISDLKIISEVGRGSTGVVMKGILYNWRNSKEQMVAIKTVVTNSDYNSESGLKDLKREFEILRDLDHENIIKTLGFMMPKDDEMQLVVEYMSYGSLLSYIKNSHHEHFKNLPLAKYALDIAKGMDYLQRMKVVHRDLALRNVLVRDPRHVKICDFGLAQFLGFDNHYKLKTDRALPLRWYAPETLETWEFSHKSDVWSYGIVVWEIYSGGCSPKYNCGIDSLSLREALKHERLLMPRGCPKPMYELMSNCWRDDPNERPSFAEIVHSLDIRKSIYSLE